jgi:hypothetical protein
MSISSRFFKFLILFLLLNGSSVWAQTKPQQALGMNLAQALANYGYPQKMTTSRGTEAWADDVVFVYPQFTLFWYQDRVWQVSVREGQTASLWGVTPGDGQAKVLSLFNTVLKNEGNVLIVQLPDQGWPSRIQFLMTEGKVREIYYYRSDF